jgi:hypothetical protein
MQALSTPPYLRSLTGLGQYAPSPIMAFSPFLEKRPASQSEMYKFLVDFHLNFFYTIVTPICISFVSGAKSRDVASNLSWKEESMESTAIIPAKFEDGTEIHILVTMLGGEEEVAAKEGGLSFDNVTKPIQKVAQEIAKVIKDVQPSKATVSLGFEVATSEGQLTALLVKGTATANLAVTLEWVKEKDAITAGKPKPARKR